MDLTQVKYVQQRSSFQYSEVYRFVIRIKSESHENFKPFRDFFFTIYSEPYKNFTTVNVRAKEIRHFVSHLKIEGLLNNINDLSLTYCDTGESLLSRSLLRTPLDIY